MGAPRPPSASPFMHSWSSGLDEEDDEEGFIGYGINSRPQSSIAALMSRPGSPIICTSPLLLKFRPSTSPAPPRVPRALTLLRDRDKESLVDEILKLSQVISDQAAYLRKQKIYGSKLRSQNRRLEQTVEDLEMLGVKAPRTGAPTRLRAIMEGLKSKLGGLEVTCVCQEEEIFQLQRDLRITISKETQVERDVFAGELARLHVVIKQLRRSNTKLVNENKEIARMREKNTLQAVSNERLAASIEAVQGSVIKVQEEMDDSRKLAEDSINEVRSINKMIDSINAHKVQLEQLIEQERQSREKLEKRSNNLSALITRTEKKMLEFVRKGGKIPGLKLRGGAPEVEEPSSISECEEALDLERSIPDVRAASPPTEMNDCSEHSDGSFHAPAVPRLNLEKLVQPDPAPGPGPELGAAPEAQQANKDKALSRTNSVSRPPSRLAFVLEGETPNQAADVQGSKGSSTKLERLQEDPPSPAQEAAATTSCLGSNIHQSIPHLRRPLSSFGDRRSYESTSSSASISKQTRDARKRSEERHKPTSSSSYNSWRSHKQLWTVSCSTKTPVLESRSQQEYECIEWLKTLEVPEEAAEAEEVVKPPQRPPTAEPGLSYAEDTLQLMHLSRPSYEQHRKPGIRRHDPP